MHEFNMLKRIGLLSTTKKEKKKKKELDLIRIKT